MLFKSFNSKMNISREIIIHAEISKIFPYINNSKLSNSWMPWQDSDKDAVMVYSGPDEGVNSKTSWDSKGRMGKGEAIVIESRPNELVKTKLIYTRPFKMSQLAQIALFQTENGVKVVWSVEAEKNFIFKIMSLFIDCDDMIGKQFDMGLVKLKNMLERN